MHVLSAFNWCMHVSFAAFAPQSKAELQRAVDVCIEMDPIGDCTTEQQLPIGWWDVSHVHDMSELFLGATSFNSDISKWDVSRVTDMYGMFRDAKSFDGDISKWDVSRVTNMTKMFWGATTFVQKISLSGKLRSVTLSNQTLCDAAWALSKANKDHMFEGFSGSICPG